jgi:hypothetical protein
MLPSVAVRTVVYGDAVALVESGDGGEVVSDPGSEEYGERLDVVAIGQADVEPVVVRRDVLYGHVPRLHTVLAQFFAAEAQQIHRRDAVSRQISVQGARAGVAGATRVAEEDAATTPAQQ